MNTLSNRLSRLVGAVILIALISAGFTPKAAAAEITSAAGLVSTSSGLLNVRSQDSADGYILTQLPSGTYVTLIAKSGDWWRVEYAPSSYGYASATYIRYVYNTYAVGAASATGSVPVRSGAGVSFSQTGTIPNGQTILTLGQSDGWFKVLYNGTRTGYIRIQETVSLMAWPVPASHKINQYFGEHEGVDIGSSVHGVSGDTVIAAQSGKVVYAGWLNGYGYVVYINSVHNGLPIQTRYGHLAAVPSVSVGQAVGPGQKIGVMGSTGTSSGVHLHFEVRLRTSYSDCIANADSKPVNPLNYVK